MKPTRVLIVDDSAFVRKALTTMLQGESDIEIVGLASNGQEAVDKTIELKPDIITMDIEMPVMNGIEALKIIMDKSPTPVLMISSLTTEGAAATIEAMSIGAVDFIPKQSTLTVQQTMKDELLSKVRAIAQNQSLKSRLSRTQQLLNSLSFRSSKSSSSQPTESKSSDAQSIERLSLQERIARRRESLKTDGSDPSPQPDMPSSSAKPLAEVRVTGRKRPANGAMKVIVLGVSTGGPLALHQVIPRLPADIPVGMLIVQHMPAHFTKSLADRLNSLSHVRVREAQDGDVLEPGLVLIAPGGFHLKIGRDHRTVQVTSEPSSTLHRPSVDVTVESVLESFGGNALGVIMTGMGRDGCAGLKKLHEKGGYIIAQDEESCVVYGMPKAVVDEGIADEVVPLEHLADSMAACLGMSAVAAKP
jgi:two-component system, chemotaxis family, protein-glutamate methylesterase/glutaminase